MNCFGEYVDLDEVGLNDWLMLWWQDDRSMADYELDKYGVCANG